MDVGIEIAFFYRGIRTPYAGKKHQALQDHRGVLQKNAGAYRLLEEMGIQPSDCTYVGDTKTDMLTGRAAGLYTLGVLWGFRDRMELEENGADRIVAHPSEIGDIILNERTELP